MRSKPSHRNARWNIPDYRLDKSRPYSAHDRFWEPMSASVTIPWEVKDAIKRYLLKYEAKTGYRVCQGEIVAEAVRRYMRGTMDRKHRV